MPSAWWRQWTPGFVSSVSASHVMIRTVLRPLQNRAVALLARGMTIKATAQELSCSERTVTRWRTEPDFLRALESARADYMAERPNGIRAVLDQALYAIKRNGEPDYPTRIQAARILLGAPQEEAEAPTVIREVIYADRLAAS